MRPWRLTGISESRRFLKLDISTAYLNAKMPEDDIVYMKLDKQMSEMLLKCETSGDDRMYRAGLLCMI